MTNIEMEKKLADGGFTSKEIALLRFMTERDSTSYQILLVELKRRFIGAMIFLAIFLSIYCYGILKITDGDYFSSVVTVIFVVLVVWFLAPLKLGAKSFFFLRKCI